MLVSYVAARRSPRLSPGPPIAFSYRAFMCQTGMGIPSLITCVPGSAIADCDGGAMRPMATEWQPLVSVIMIFWNAERFITSAIESVLAQTYDRWELILVDDGSTDASTLLACRYAI